ncbi:MAG: serine hydrolase [Planctomycetota bacterium]
MLDFKLALAGLVLREAAAQRLDLGECLPFGAADMVVHAPITKQYIAVGSLPIALLALGDQVTRLDRFEPDMNFVPIGELRDTTTPAAMAQLTARLVVGDALPPDARDRLANWAIVTATGLRRLRASLPADWHAGDKIGSSRNDAMANKVNDVAIVWPPGRAPWVVAAYYDAPGRFDAMRAEDEAVLAEVARIVSGTRDHTLIDTPLLAEPTPTALWNEAARRIPDPVDAARTLLNTPPRRQTLPCPTQSTNACAASSTTRSPCRQRPAPNCWRASAATTPRCAKDCWRCSKPRTASSSWPHRPAPASRQQPRRSRATKDLAAASVPTSCCNRSVKAASARCSWPNSRRRSCAASR